MNPNLAGLYLTDPVFATYPLWLADYGVSTPQVPKVWTDAGKTWPFWQYAANGTLAGAPDAHHNVDLDYFNGDEAALKQFIGDH